MSTKLEFWTPVIAGDFRQFPSLNAVEAFDDYFDLQGRKCQVIGNTGNNKFEVSKSKQQAQALALTILKVCSYITLIIPLVMLIGKAIARARIELIYGSETPKPIQTWTNHTPKLEMEAAVVIQSYRRMLKARKGLQTRKNAIVTIQTCFNKIKRERKEAHALGDEARILLETKKREPKTLQVIFSLHEFVKNEWGFYEELKKHCEFMAREDFLSCLRNQDDRQDYNDFIEKFMLLFRHNGNMIRRLEDIADYFKEIKFTEEQKTNLKGKTPNELKNNIRKMHELLSNRSSELYLKALSEIIRDEKRICEMIDREKLNNLEGGLKSNFDPTAIIVQRFTRFPLMLETIISKIEALGLHDEAELIKEVHDKIKSIAIGNNTIKNINLCEYFLEKQKDLSLLIKQPGWWNWIVGGLQGEIDKLHDDIISVLSQIKLTKNADLVSEEARLTVLCTELTKIIIPKYHQKLAELQKREQNLTPLEREELEVLRTRIKEAQELISSTHSLENSWIQVTAE